MDVSGPIALETFLDGIGKNEKAVFFTEREGEALSNRFSGNVMTAIVGPEGGWDDSEITAARSAGADVVTLGGRVLRAETAAIAVATILQHRFGDIN
jgi:16S rRNA (uracil1498-N3)-methyltransferase